MSRNKGTFDFSNNFEVRARSPLDAKQRVGTLADLTSPTQWQSNTGDEWTFPGMIVSVYNDGTNNGVYRLTASDYTILSNWDKLGASGDITSLSTALSNEISTRNSADSTLSSAISTEASTRSSHDTSLSIALSSEATTRSGADSTLSSTISSETSARISAVSSEAGARSSADSTLSSAISSEASSRAAADSTFLVKTNNLSDLTNTTTARINLGLGNVDNTADANKSVNYANTANYAASAGSSGGVAWSNVSSKPNWAGSYFYDASTGTYITNPAWFVDQMRIGNFSDTTVREVNIWGQLVHNSLIASSTVSYTIDRRAGWGSTTAHMVVIPWYGGAPNTKSIYLPGATGAGQTVDIGTEINFVNNGWHHFTVIGRRTDMGPYGYQLAWNGVITDSYTFEDFRNVTFVFGGQYWCMTSHVG